MSRTGSGPVSRRSPRTAPLVRRWQIARPLDEFFANQSSAARSRSPVRRRRSAKIVPLTPYGFSPIAAEKHSGPTPTRMSRRLWMSLSAITRSAPRGRRSESLSLRPARHGGKPPNGLRPLTWNEAETRRPTRPSGVRPIGDLRRRISAARSAEPNRRPDRSQTRGNRGCHRSRLRDPEASSGHSGSNQDFTDRPADPGPAGAGL